MISEVLPFHPAVFVVESNYQIVFLTSTKGLGWIEIGGERFTDEEAGLLHYGNVHKIPVPGFTLNRAGKYTVVYVEYADKRAYFPEGIEKFRKEYIFRPIREEQENIRIFHFADTHARTETPLALFRATGDCDLIVLNGDINESGCDLKNFETTFELISGSARGEVPVICFRGNHDTRGCVAQDQLHYIPTAFREGRRETFYSFRQGPLWGLVLDCGEDKEDGHEEYGGTVLFDAFRKRETAFLRTVIENKQKEYAAEDVKYRIVICHIPFVERFDYPFDVADDIYNEWTELLNEMEIDLMLSGHTHRAYFIPAHTDRNRNAAFPTAVCSIPCLKQADGNEYYAGGLVAFTPTYRTVQAVPLPEIWQF